MVSKNTTWTLALPPSNSMRAARVRTMRRLQDSGNEASAVEPAFGSSPVQPVRRRESGAEKPRSQPELISQRSQAPTLSQRSARQSLKPQSQPETHSRRESRGRAEAKKTAQEVSSHSSDDSVVVLDNSPAKSAKEAAKRVRARKSDVSPAKVPATASIRTNAPETLRAHQPTMRKSDSSDSVFARDGRVAGMATTMLQDQPETVQRPTSEASASAYRAPRAVPESRVPETHRSVDVGASTGGMHVTVASDVHYVHSSPHVAAPAQRNANTHEQNGFGQSTHGNQAPAAPVQTAMRTDATTISMQNTIAEQQQLIEELRDNFQQLSLLRTTEAEQLFSDYRRSAEQRIAAAETLIESLRREREQLLDTVAQTNGTSDRRSSGAFSDVSVASRAIPAPLLALHQAMSGLEMMPSAADPQHEWNCVLSGRTGEISFDLALVYEDPADDDISADGDSHADGSRRTSRAASLVGRPSLGHLRQQYIYTPTFAPSSSIAARLPPYLQEEIAFDADQLQSFFWRALNFLMSPK